MGKRSVSHRYNYLPLLPSGPGGIQQELIVQDLPGDKSKKNCIPDKRNKGYADTFPQT